jgi:hypothetical protein
MRKALIALAFGALFMLGWWVGGGEFVRGPELASAMATSVFVAVFVFFMQNR